MRALKVSIVIPTFNERRNISILIPRVVEVLHKNRITGEIIVVDDNSEDGTADEVRRLARKFGGICEIRLIEQGRKMGIGTAYKRGFAHANGDILFEMDGDLSHDPALIPAFLRKLLEEKCEVVIGSRYVRGGGVNDWGILRRIISAGANLMASKLLNLGIKDATSGYRAYKREVIESINSEICSEGYAFQVEMVYFATKNGFKVAEIPIIFKNREDGKSKLGLKEVVRFFVTVSKLALDRRLRRR